MYDIIFTQRKSIKNFNRSLTILGGGGRIAPDPPKGDKPEKETFMITLKMLLQKTTKAIDNQSN